MWHRFTHDAEKKLRPFVDLSIVNELDVIEHAPTVAKKYGEYFRTLFRSWSQLASDAVTAEARRTLPF